MPPFVPRKRERENDHGAHESPLPQVSARKAALGTKSKTSVFDAIDQPPTHFNKSVKEKKKLLEILHHDDGSDSLSEVDSDDFEDVLPSKRRKTYKDQSMSQVKHKGGIEDGEQDEDEEDDDDFTWEDAIPDQTTKDPCNPSTVNHRKSDIADVSISVTENGNYIEPMRATGVAKKGPSKRERQARLNTHYLHVQSLMWHNTIRNSWLNDKALQNCLIESLTEGVRREVLRWKDSMGRLSKEELEAKEREAAKKNKSKKGRKSKQKSVGREWNYDADHLEQGVPDLSHGDPLFRLLKVLAAYWRKRFVITAPGLRKQGYKDLRRIRDDINHWKAHPDAAEDHGERIKNLNDFRELARRCEGSRDVGAQLFVALLRGLGLECRLVSNLQPIGFGWSKSEDAFPRRLQKVTPAISTTPNMAGRSRDQEVVSKKTERRTKMGDGKRAQMFPRGDKTDPVSLADSDSSLSSAPDDTDLDASDQFEDDSSVMEILPPTPKHKIVKKYDRDLAYPVYWAEVCSPASNKFIPVDPVVLSTIGSNEELVQSLEPRGKKAELAKQVICYTVAHNSDGTAKDVTIRYLKKHQLPGKTKGFRIPPERLPILNRKGKVIRYVDHDWFKTVMLSYERPKPQRSQADELEEMTDLKSFKPATHTQDAEKESLQWYKQSAEFVLEQHLRREEALLPDAEPVKTFVAGKGDKAKEHPVYKRADVVACKTVESWHKEGRELRAGQHPMKLVPMRAVTLVRKREIEDAQRETGEKLKQGLYSRDQTDWIIPPPIENGIIPKNAFGNMDVYVPTMVPKGAVHLPLKGSAKVCRKLDINFAEACTGFEFGKQRAVPVLTGVVVAKENEKLVRDAWREDQAERKRKEDTKRTALTLHWWRKMLLGLRVIERMRIEYQGVDLAEEDINPFIARAQRHKKQEQPDDIVGDNTDNMAGGFLASDGEGDTLMSEQAESELGGGFLLEEETDALNGHLVLDNGITDSRSSGHIPPMSLQSVHKEGSPHSDAESTGVESDSDDQAEKQHSTNKGKKSPATRNVRQTSGKLFQSSTRTSNRLAAKQLQGTPGRGSRVRAKATPFKSQYFAHDEDSDEG